MGVHLIISLTTMHTFQTYYIDKNAKRLYGNHSSVTVEPAFVKRYMKTLANRDFCKKKLDTRFDTHRIKTGVQLWCSSGDSNPGHPA